MKIVKLETLVDAGSFTKTPDWEVIHRHIVESIKKIEWPAGAGSFTLYDESGKKRGQGSGVKPIKVDFMKKLASLGWALETPLDIATVKRPGAMDATYQVKDKCFCIEWETGNISSSHRAINKMALGILKGILIGGILIVPTRNMYRYLTDRVGNLTELEPYFPLWRSLKVKEGFLAVMAVEHDAVSRSVPRIPKGTDGRALE